MKSSSKLRSISLANFRSFAGKHRIELPESGAVLLRGTNFDSGGSSGSGKSSVILGIQYALGSCSFAATELQSWHTEDPLQVTLELDTPAGALTITRGKKLAVTVDGKKLGGAAKSQEEAIQNALGLSPELLRALTYREQRSDGTFLSKANAEAQSFLSDLLGLHRFEEAVQVSKARQGELLTEIESKSYTVNSEEASIGAVVLVPPVLQDLAALELEVQEVEAGIVSRKTNRNLLLERVTELRTESTEKVRVATAPFVDSLARAKQEMEETANVSVPAPDTTELSRLRTLLAETKERHNRLKLDDRAAEQAQNQAWSNKRQEIHSLETQLDDREELEPEIFELNYQIALLETDQCPTCKQKWEKGSDKLRALKAEVAAKDVLLAALDDIPPQLETLKREELALRAFTPSPMVEKFSEIFQKVSTDLANEQARLSGLAAMAKAHLDGVAAKLKNKYLELKTEAQAAAAEVTRSIQTDIDALQAEASKIEISVSQWETKRRVKADQLRNFQSANTSLTIDYTLKERHLAQRRAALDVVRGQLEVLENELGLEQDFVAMIGPTGFLGSIFDEVLAEISEETNRVLASVPNTSHVALTFQSESLTAAGKVRKGIKSVVSVGGHEAPLASGLSGGMLSAVHFAVDLAVNVVVCRRLGVSPGWLVMDEPFDGLGALEKSGCLEILQRFVADRQMLVLVIDHTSETKELFSAGIDIEYRGGFSSVN